MELQNKTYHVLLHMKPDTEIVNTSKKCKSSGQQQSTEQKQSSIILYQMTETNQKKSLGRGSKIIGSQIRNPDYRV